jgi:hypothetical protein
MKTVQALGCLLLLVALTLAALLFRDLPSQAWASQAGAAGIFLFFALGPAVGAAGLLLLPSTLILLWPRMRQRFGIRGFWLGLWGLNLMVVLTGVALAAWVGWVVLTSPFPR